MAGRSLLHRFDRYCELLDSCTARDPVISEIQPRAIDDGPVRALCYMGVPQPGYVTGFTYGLSLSSRSNGAVVGRELSITVRSENVEWSQVPARIVAALRGIAPFDPGQVLGYVEPYVEGSAMNSIVLAASAVECGLLDLGGGEGAENPRDLIEIVGAYPIHSSERELVYSQGFDVLWGMTWDRFDPARIPVT